MFCCTVRYSLSGGNGIPCRRVRYYPPGALTRDNRVFAGFLLKVVSEPGRSAQRGGANLSAGTVFFVWKYGIDLLAGTVLGGTGRGSRSCRRVRYSSEALACLSKRYLWENPRSLRRSQAQELITLIRVMMDGRLAGEYAIFDVRSGTQA